MRNKKWCWKLLFIPLFILAITAVTMWLWNAILPQLFAVGSISFWQALGLLILSRILFGGFGCRGRNKGPNRFGNRFQHKCHKMSKEEKQKFKEEWRNRCFGKKPAQGNE